MSRYIDADKLIDDIRPFAGYDSNRSNKDWVRRFEITINAQPTADVVEVVRCKDCKHYRIWEMKCDRLHAKPFADNHYCGFGERADK